MATKKISELTAASVSAMTDLYEIETAGGGSFKATLLQMFTTGLVAGLPMAATTFTAASGVTISPATGAVTVNPTSAGTINNMSVGVTTAAAGRFTTLTATAAVTLSPASANVVLSPTGTGVVTINPATAGAMDNVAIGGTTALAGKFTTLAATSTLAVTGAAGIGGTLTSSGAFIALSSVSLSPASANVVLSPTGTGIVTINPATLGSINNTSIGQTTAAAGKFTVLEATSTLAVTGAVSFQSSLTVTGAANVGGILTASGSFTALAAVALSPASANVVLSPTGTGVVTINPATAGTMNNVVIGGGTALAGTFTTSTAANFVATNSLTVTGSTSITTFYGPVLAGNGSWAISPIGNNVTISPTGTGTATINPGGAGTINNMSLGVTTPLAGKFTTLAATTSLSVTGQATLVGSSGAPALIVPNTIEPSTIVAAGATGTINFDVTTQSIVYYTASGTANWTINFRGNSGFTLNNMLRVGDVVTGSFWSTQGATGFINSTVQVDGTTSGVTTKWQTSAPASGGVNGIDAYAYAITKTAASTFTILASQSPFV